MNSGKLKNWKQSVEIDYLSLYIKTWFAFLSSLKQLYPTIVSQSGDGLLIKHYQNNLTLPVNFESDIKAHIQKAFKAGSVVIKRDLPDSFFGRYYSANSSFRYSIPNSVSHVRFKVEYKSKSYNQRKPNLFIDFKSTQAQFLKNFKLHHFTLNIPISEFTSKGIYDDQVECVKYVLQAMEDVANRHVDGMPHLQAAGINQRKAYINTILTLIGQHWRPNFRIEQLFQPLPVTGFPDEYDEGLHKIAVVKWFIRFSYDLRNILFHHIIDPFDEEWLKLFKHTYLALKEIVNHNINLINQMSEITES